jgi:RNA polymerase sigma-70 factor (ECF subfamily)
VVEEGAWRVALRMPAAGEATAFVGLVQPELPGAYRLAGYLLRDAADAEDATQVALEKAWQVWPKLRETDRFGAWFDRIVVNVCRDRLRAKRGSRVLELDDEALARDEVGRLIRKLPPDHQIVVALRFWRDLSVEEIAERLQMPSGTVKSRLHYAMKTLRQEIDRQGGEAQR